MVSCYRGVQTTEQRTRHIPSLQDSHTTRAHCMWPECPRLQVRQTGEVEKPGSFPHLGKQYKCTHHSDAGDSVEVVGGKHMIQSQRDLRLNPGSVGFLGKLRNFLDYQLISSGGCSPTWGKPGSCQPSRARKCVVSSTVHRVQVQGSAQALLTRSRVLWAGQGRAGQNGPVEARSGGSFT